MIETVIKVGGSLGENSNLQTLLQSISDFATRYKILIVPGGGIFANTVRDYEQRFGLAGEAGHWMSILAMDQYGHLLASMVENSTLVQDLDAARMAISSGKIPIFLPYHFLAKTDVLPKSWDVTSDSIAAWIADLAEARQLILLKSVDGLFTDDKGPNSRTRLMETASLSQVACSEELVDHYFCSIAKTTSLDIWLVNGNYPERLEQLLETGTAKGTNLHR
jgi:5-(aminomethyl)-3-furanmethanol phosphate kinase